MKLCIEATNTVCLRNDHVCKLLDFEKSMLLTWSPVFFATCNTNVSST